MSSKTIVWDLYNFLKDGVTNESLQEANKTAYPSKGAVKLNEKLKEGKVPTDPSTVTYDQIQQLAEKDKEKAKEVADEEAAPAPITPDPILTKVEIEAEKNAPNIDKLTQDDKTGEIPEKKAAKTDKKDVSLPKVTTIKKEKAENEGKLPSDNGKDNATIDNPEQQIQWLSEDRAVATVSDETAAKAIQAKYPGSTITVAKDASGKAEGYTIMIKETTVDVTTDDGKAVNVTTDGATTTVTTNTTPAAEVTVDAAAPVLPAEEEVVHAPVDELPMTDEESMEMAEKIFVVEHLKTKKELKENEAKFIKDVEAIKLTEKQQKAVNEKLATLKEKK